MNKRLLLIAALFFMMVCAVSAQKKESLAVFPFTGGNAADGEAIASSLTRRVELRNAFNRTTLITRNTIAAMNFEQRFQRGSGLTDADTIFELGKALNAAYVIAGYITTFSDRNLVVVSIMDVESLQQVAGDYRTYKSIDEIDALIPEIAKKLAAAVSRDTSKLPGLSVPPFVISSEVNENDAMVLAQILACDLANSGKYAVLPRTDSIAKVLEEHQRQRDGTTNQERIKRLGVGRNAEFVLSGSVQKLGDINKFAADILNLGNGSYHDGYEKEYSDFTEGLTVVPELATVLSGETPAAVPAFVRVEGGTFLMGSNNGESNEKPVHSVTVKSFSIGKYEVTQKEWVEVMMHNPSHFKGDSRPVERVSWNDAVEYCNRRSQKEGLTPVYRNSAGNIVCDFMANGYRLPTEAEWEFVAKGGNRDLIPYMFSGSDNEGTVAWYEDNSGGKTSPVGMKAPNSLGIYDMSGNVWEWCGDFQRTYSGEAQTDPVGAPGSGGHVIRGGSWTHVTGYLRSAVRGTYGASDRLNYIGFRLVRKGD